MSIDLSERRAVTPGLKNRNREDHAVRSQYRETWDLNMAPDFEGFVDITPVDSRLYDNRCPRRRPAPDFVFDQLRSPRLVFICSGGPKFHRLLPSQYDF